MIIEGKNISRGLTLSCQVCVIGSGAGGAVAAKELTEGGLDVVLLEEGGYYTSKDFNQREEDMMPKLYANAGLFTNSDFSMSIAYGRCVGGSTTHNIGLCFHPEPAILDRWQKEYDVKDLSYKELLPHIKKVEQHIGVNQISEDSLNANNSLLKKGADALGYHGLIPRHNRMNCLGSGFCELGCAYDRLQTMLITYIPQASKRGARVYSDCRAGKIKKTGSGFEVEVEVLEREHHKAINKVKVKAEKVVVSCGAIQSPALLFKSGIQSPSGYLGKTLHLHPYIPVAAVFKERVEGWKGIPQTYVVDHFADFKKDGYGGFVVIPGFAHPGTFASLAPSWGKEHFEMMKLYPHIAIAGAMVHDETIGSVMIKKDGQAKVRYFPEGKDIYFLQEGIKRMAQMFLSAGAQKVLLPYTNLTWITKESELSIVEKNGIVPHQILLASVHPQGSCRMGEKKDACVVNSYGEFHGVKNLFVCDGSVFSTSLGSPPQISIMALATRTAEYIISE